MSSNVHVRLREKGGGQKWPCCTFARDAILNSSLLAEANVLGSRGLILTETRGGSLPTSKYSILGKPKKARTRALLKRPLTIDRVLAL